MSNIKNLPRPILMGRARNQLNRSESDKRPQHPRLNIPTGPLADATVTQVTPAAGRNADLEKLRKLKEEILNGQHPHFRPVPHPEVLQSLMLPADSGNNAALNGKHDLTERLEKGKVGVGGSHLAAGTVMRPPDGTQTMMHARNGPVDARPTFSIPTGFGNSAPSQAVGNRENGNLNGSGPAARTLSNSDPATTSLPNQTAANPTKPASATVNISVPQSSSSSKLGTAETAGLLSGPALPTIPPGTNLANVVPDQRVREFRQRSDTIRSSDGQDPMSATKETMTRGMPEPSGPVGRRPLPPPVNDQLGKATAVKKENPGAPKLRNGIPAPNRNEEVAANERNRANGMPHGKAPVSATGLPAVPVMQIKKEEIEQTVGSVAPFRPPVTRSTLNTSGIVARNTGDVSVQQRPDNSPRKPNGPPLREPMGPPSGRRDSAQSQRFASPMRGDFRRRGGGPPSPPSRRPSSPSRFGSQDDRRPDRYPVDRPGDNHASAPRRDDSQYTQDSDNMSRRSSLPQSAILQRRLNDPLHRVSQNSWLSSSTDLPYDERTNTRTDSFLSDASRDRRRPSDAVLEERRRDSPISSVRLLNAPPPPERDWQMRDEGPIPREEDRVPYNDPSAFRRGSGSAWVDDRPGRSPPRDIIPRGRSPTREPFYEGRGPVGGFVRSPSPLSPRRGPSQPRLRSRSPLMFRGRSPSLRQRSPFFRPRSRSPPPRSSPPYHRRTPSPPRRPYSPYGVIRRPSSPEPADRDQSRLPLAARLSDPRLPLSERLSDPYDRRPVDNLTLAAYERPERGMEPPPYAAPRLRSRSPPYADYYPRDDAGAYRLPKDEYGRDTPYSPPRAATYPAGTYPPYNDYRPASPDPWEYYDDSGPYERPLSPPPGAQYDRRGPY